MTEERYAPEEEAPSGTPAEPTGDEVEETEGPDTEADDDDDEEKQDQQTG